MNVIRRSTRALALPMLSLALAVGIGAPGSAFAEEFYLKLSGSHEVPPVASSGSAQGEIEVSDDGSVSGKVTVTGFTPTMAHIHEAAAGKNGKVVIPFTMEGSTFVAPPGAKLSADQMKALKAGDLYFNVHSAAHPGGEVRAQLVR